jgi:uncharacterized protein involved in outer membrane biogenesis
MQLSEVFNRKKSLWLITIGALVGLLIVLLGVAVLILSLNANAYKPRLEVTASQALGMEVKIAGPLDIHLFPGIQLTLHDVHVGTNGVDIASVPEARLRIKIFPLLFKHVQIESLTLDQPTVSIERAKDGQFNFATPLSSGGALPAMYLSDFTLTDGTFHYLDQRTGESFAADSCNLLVHDLQFYQGKLSDLMKDITFNANLSCDELRNNGFTISSLKISAIGQQGIIDLKPVTMQVFGAQGAGNLHADFSRAVAQYSIHYSLPQFQVAEFFKALSSHKIAEGDMDFTADLTFQGNALADMRRTLAGRVSLRGRNLTLEGHDLDKDIASFKSSQHFNLVDIGAVYLAGPFGLIITKGYNFASLLHGSGGSSDIPILVSDWKVDAGVAQSQDVAMATEKNRIAIKGGLDLINDKFVNMTVAVINANGCAVVQQTIRGSFNEPVVEHQGIANTLTGPAQKLLKKVRDLFPGGKCQVFYAGSVMSPK